MLLSLLTNGCYFQLEVGTAVLLSLLTNGCYFQLEYLKLGTPVLLSLLTNGCYFQLEYLSVTVSISESLRGRTIDCVMLYVKCLSKNVKMHTSKAIMQIKILDILHKF